MSLVLIPNLEERYRRVTDQRFIGREDIYDEFTGKLSEKMSSPIVRDPTDPATEIGPLATESG
jgi:succinate-semialdehyde dehydrogenase/glutarate-semialdehyde dehydrogenase